MQAFFMSLSKVHIYLTSQTELTNMANSCEIYVVRYSCLTSKEHLLKFFSDIAVQTALCLMKWWRNADRAFDECSNLDIFCCPLIIWSSVTLMTQNDKTFTEQFLLKMHGEYNPFSAYCIQVDELVVFL